jgi:membrane protein
MADAAKATKQTVRRTATEFLDDNLIDWAAALTSYSFLAIFPALIVLVSIVGLFGDAHSAVRAITRIATQIGPPSGAHTLSGPIRSITSDRPTAGVVLVAGLLGALWSASRYVGAFARASNVIYETPESRPGWKLRPLQVLITLAMVVLTAFLLLALVLTGPIVDDVAQQMGIGSTVTTIWDVTKWPVMMVALVALVSLLYYTTPNAKPRGFKWVTPGSAVAVVTWLVASALFASYASGFGSFQSAYGALGGVVVMVIWLWITNLALLFGHELDAEREREIKEGVPHADRRIKAEPRAIPDERPEG